MSQWTTVTRKTKTVSPEHDGANGAPGKDRERVESRNRNRQKTLRAEDRDTTDPELSKKSKIYVQWRRLPEIFCCNSERLQ